MVFRRRRRVRQKQKKKRVNYCLKEKGNKWPKSAFFSIDLWALVADKLPHRNRKNENWSIRLIIFQCEVAPADFWDSVRSLNSGLILLNENFSIKYFLFFSTFVLAAKKHLVQFFIYCSHCMSPFFCTPTSNTTFPPERTHMSVHCSSVWQNKRWQNGHHHHHPAI